MCVACPLAVYTHPSATSVATVTETTPWYRLWDPTLDRGKQGIRRMQSL